MYAITPKGTGEKVGARAIRPDWELMEGETFSVESFNENDVLAEDQSSLREGTQDELNPPDMRTNAEKLEDSTGMTVDDIKNVLGL